MHLENESMYMGRFRILKKLGEGGSSIVYLAVDEKNNTPVTIKKIKEEICGNNDVSLLVSDETEILKTLDSPAIPKVVEIFGDSFVMEYVPGNSLEKYLKKYGRLEEKKAVKLAQEILEILDYLHGLKTPVIYRDLKPSNIMIKPDGHVSLIDFGASRLYNPEDRADTLNLGTCGFAAPEQYGSLGQTDKRTDIYCFGKTLIQMVGGKCSPELMNVIEKCTRPDRDDRFESCREIKTALRTYPKKKLIRKTLNNLKIACAAAMASFVIAVCVANHDTVVSYAANDAETRLPAVKERLGLAGFRIKELVMENDLWTDAGDRGEELK